MYLVLRAGDQMGSPRERMQMEERMGASEEVVEEWPRGRRNGSEKVPGERENHYSTPSHVLYPPTPSSRSQDLRRSSLWDREVAWV